METKKLDVVRRRLLREREQLMQRRAATLDEEQQLLDAKEADWEDTAADRTTARLLDRLSDSELIHIARLGAALHRIEAGVYGRCTVCGGPIAAGRLRALPEADRCRACMPTH